MTNKYRVAVLLGACVLVLPFVTHANHTVNINTADKETLVTLTGIGEVKAQDIIDYREANGPFAQKEDIQNVSGIGVATYENIKDHIIVAGDSSPPPETTEETTNSGEQSVTQQYIAGAPSTEPQIIADAGVDRTVIVGADTVFEGKVFTTDGESLGPGGITFVWNFGDGKAVGGNQVMHAFAHPGRYVVILNVSASKEAASDRVTVTAKPATFVLSHLSDGSAVVENATDRELDLSFWYVKSGTNYFALPEDTIILEDEKIIIPPASLGFTVSDEWQLLYPNGEVAETATPPKPVIIHASSIPKPDPTASVVQVSTTQTPDKNLDLVGPEPSSEPNQETQVAAATSFAPNEPSDYSMQPWIFGLAGLVSIGAVGAYFTARANRKEWDIIEDQG